MKGIVSDIQRFSLKDGPGIRTSVFLKGCNMRCPWCHNPETLSREPQLLRAPDRCIGCGACARVCPSGALRLTKDGVRFEAERCVGCLRCAGECFTDALRVDSREMSVEEVMAEALADAPYYRQSGGGVTLTGGEATTQPAFAKALLSACGDAGVATAMETNLSAPWSVLCELTPLLDLVMFDIKLADEEAHRRLTGVELARVLDNARRLRDEGKPAIVRTPVVPGVNDTEAQIAAIAREVGRLHNVVAYELLRFNPLGESKYEALRVPNAFRGIRPTPPERMRALADAAAREARVTVRIG